MVHQFSLHANENRDSKHDIDVSTRVERPFGQQHGLNPSESQNEPYKSSNQSPEKVIIGRCTITCCIPKGIN